MNAKDKIYQIIHELIKNSKVNPQNGTITCYDREFTGTMQDIMKLVDELGISKKSLDLNKYQQIYYETILLRLDLIHKYNGVDEVIINGIIDSLDNLIDLLKEE